MLIKNVWSFCITIAIGHRNYKRRSDILFTGIKRYKKSDLCFLINSIPLRLSSWVGHLHRIYTSWQVVQWQTWKIYIYALTCSPRGRRRKKTWENPLDRDSPTSLIPHIPIYWWISDNPRLRGLEGIHYHRHLWCSAGALGTSRCTSYAALGALRSEDGSHCPLGCGNSHLC